MAGSGGSRDLEAATPAPPPAAAAAVTSPKRWLRTLQTSIQQIVNHGGLPPDPTPARSSRSSRPSRSSTTRSHAVSMSDDFSARPNTPHTLSQPQLPRASVILGGSLLSRLGSVSVAKGQPVSGALMSAKDKLYAGGAGDIVAAVRSLRKASMVIYNSGDTNSSPALAAKAGSLATYLYAPNPAAGRGICFSPCGKYMLRYGYGPDLKILSTSSCTVLATVQKTAGHIRFATFSPDGMLIAAATDDCRLLVWKLDEAVSGRRVDAHANIDVGAEPLAYCLVSPDGGNVLSCDDDGQLELWSIRDEVMVRRFEVNHAAKRASFNNFGNMVISCSDFDIQVTLLDTESGSIIATESFEHLEESRNKCSYVISADGGYVLVFITEQCYVCNCAVYNTRTQTYHHLLACAGNIAHAEFSHDGADFIVAGRDDLIHVFDSSTGSAIVTLQGHASDVLFCRTSPDRRHAISGDNSGQVLLWDVDTGTCQVRLQAHTAPVVMCDLSRDCSRALTLDAEGHAYVWNLGIQGLCDVLRQNSDILCCMAYMPGGNEIVVGYSDGTVRFWLCRGESIGQKWSHSHHGACQVECVAARPDGKSIASGARDGQVLICSATNGSLIMRLSGHTGCVTSLQMSFDGNLLVGSSRDGTAKVWNVESTSPVAVHTIRVPNDSEVLACAVDSVGRSVALGCGCGTTYIYSLQSSRQKHALLVSNVAVQAVMFCPAGKYLAIGCADGCTAIMDAESGQCLRHLVGNAEGVLAAWFPPNAVKPASLNDMKLMTVCSRQAILWDTQNSSTSSIADFVADAENMFINRTMQNRYFVGHHCLSLFDPVLNAAMYDMRQYDKHPGDSYLFRRGTQLLMSGNTHQPMVVFSPPDATLHMLLNESGGARALDFSSDGHLLVSGNLRGELLVWDVEHRCLLHKWAAHKRSAITCVKFSHDSQSIYSCGEDCKVILWNWRTQTQTAQLIGHKTAVTSVDMSLDGAVMSSGDKDGLVIVWDTESLLPKQIIAAHEGTVLCCSCSPDGTKVASSGADEHLVVMDSSTGEELLVLDAALDGKGLTIKFSFDGSRVLIGGDKGSVLIWDVQRDCLLYDIAAHTGKVYDCSWSGDSRRLLSVGSDGRARLWDAASGAEICMANLGRGFGVVDAGGFLKCDLSVDGSTMAGCTARGQLVLWSVSAELRRGPEGSMLYQWLASMPLSRARDIYSALLEHFPLLMNTQDSRGWTVLMHAAHDSNPEILKLIVSNVRSRSGMLGLTASAASRGISSNELRAATLVNASALSVHRNSKPTGLPTMADQDLAALGIDDARSSRMQGPGSGPLRSSRQPRLPASKRAAGGGTAGATGGSSTHGPSPLGGASTTTHGHPKRSSTATMGDRPSRESPGARAVAKQPSRWWQRFIPGQTKVTPLPLEEGSGSADSEQLGDHDHDDDMDKPNAVSIALAANSADCVGHLLDAVLSEKITPGSYHAITAAIPEVAERYPALCETFMAGLPLLVLGDVEVPSNIAAQGRIVRAANSYTSYKEMWAEALQLNQAEANCPMVVMEASMVRLPFAAENGSDSLLRTLVEASVPVETFGAATVQAIITYKWERFARKQIYTKSLVYLTYVLLFTAYAVVFSDDVPSDTLHDLLDNSKGRTTIVLSIILFMFGLYYMAMELYQMYTIGLKAYFDSFWNFIDLGSYAATMVITPCVVLRVAVDQGRFVPALISLEVILLWIKQMFFALAVDGLGTFIYMTFEIVKGMRYFILLLMILFASFGTAFMVLFRGPGLLPPDTDPSTIPPGALDLYNKFSDMGQALLNAFVIMFGNFDPTEALETDWPQLATILTSLYTFALIVVLLNMLITLMGTVYTKVVRKENHVFLQGRAELIIEVETTMNLTHASACVPPYLHILRPAGKAQRSSDSDELTEQQRKSDGGSNEDAPTAAEEHASGDGGGDVSSTGGARRSSGASGSTTMRRTTTFGSSHTNSRRMTVMRQSTVGTIAEENTSKEDVEMLLRETLGIKRMLEVLTRQVKLLDANQHLIMSHHNVEPRDVDDGRPSAPVRLSHPDPFIAFTEQSTVEPAASMTEAHKGRAGSHSRAASLTGPLPGRVPSNNGAAAVTWQGEVPDPNEHPDPRRPSLAALPVEDASTTPASAPLPSPGAKSVLKTRMSAMDRPSGNAAGAADSGHNSASHVSFSQPRPPRHVQPRVSDAPSVEDNIEVRPPSRETSMLPVKTVGIKTLPRSTTQHRPNGGQP